MLQAKKSKTGVKVQNYRVGPLPDPHKHGTWKTTNRTNARRMLRIMPTPFPQTKPLERRERTLICFSRHCIYRHTAPSAVRYVFKEYSSRIAPSKSVQATRTANASKRYRPADSITKHEAEIRRGNTSSWHWKRKTPRHRASKLARKIAASRPFTRKKQSPALGNSDKLGIKLRLAKKINQSESTR